VPEALARKLGVVPLRASESVLTLATARPATRTRSAPIAAGSGRRVRFAVAPPAVVAAGIDALYGGAAQGATGVAALAARAPAEPAARRPGRRRRAPPWCASSTASSRTPSRAGRATSTSSAESSAVAVRYRVDGVLRDATTLSRDDGVPIVSRIKIISGLDIADRLRPQDGRARALVDGRTVDLRVSTLPAAHGEKVVIRVLPARASAPTLDALGLVEPDASRLAALLDAREGMVLVTGPTGSGKTTTLYTALGHVQRRGVNVVTVEDPVEYRLPGIAQVQVNERAGLTFAAALRSILRQDPDVVLVGEIRDRETATIAVQASLTGHLVLSTLHTIDAAGAVTRLADLGVEPFKLAAALRGVVAQRLVRKLCDRCRRRGGGCAECGDTGYRGRVAVVEVLAGDAEVARQIARGAPTADVAAAARAGGMRSLWDSGMGQVRIGVTDLDELRRSIDQPGAAPPARLRRVARPARPRRDLRAALTHARGVVSFPE
jgi:Tfp pilus assembly pilus retraction ATPase PilT